MSPGSVTDGVTLFIPQKVMTFLVIVLQNTVTTLTLSAFPGVLVIQPQNI